MCNSLAQALFSRTGEERCISDVGRSYDEEGGEGKGGGRGDGMCTEEASEGDAGISTHKSLSYQMHSPTASVGLEADAGSPTTTDGSSMPSPSLGAAGKSPALRGVDTRDIERLFRQLNEAVRECTRPGDFERGARVDRSNCGSEKKRLKVSELFGESDMSHSNSFTNHNSYALYRAPERWREAFCSLARRPLAPADCHCGHPHWLIGGRHCCQY